MAKTPAYRHKKSRNTAVVTLTDSATKERRDYQLGDYDTPQSRERYHCLIAQWEAADRRLPALKRQAGEGGATINEIIAAYMPVAVQRFSPVSMFSKSRMHYASCASFTVHLPPKISDQ